jgi:DNA replication protein DnaC
MTEKISEVLNKSGLFIKLTQDNINDMYEKQLKHAKTQKEKEILKIYYKGGNCPFCNKEAVRTVGKAPILEDVIYYRYNCNCIEKREENRNLANMLKNAGVPLEFTEVDIRMWNKNVSKQITKAYNYIVEYVKRKEWKNNRGIISFGTVGTGKTHLMICVMKELIRNRLYIRYESMADIIAKMINRVEGNIYIQDLYSCDGILFDDLDKIHLESGWSRERIFALIDKMVHNKKIILATANFEKPADFHNKFGEAITSRLMKYCLFIKFEGDDYRIKE